MNTGLPPLIHGHSVVIRRGGGGPGEGGTDSLKVPTQCQRPYIRETMYSALNL